MAVVSVAQAAHRLGIDAKTLRRWLAEAQLPMHSHPEDGRKKGVSDEHLQALARLHQRRLAPCSPEPPAPVENLMPALPATLLALPEQLDALQAQLASLQQQVVTLTHLLQPHAQEPAFPVAPAKLPRTTRRPPKPAPSAPRVSSCYPNVPQARACHPARGVWQRRALCGDLSQAWRAAV